MERERDRRGAVLIVEDNYSLRVTLAAVLEEAGYAVATATNGATALRHIESATSPTLVVLDLMLPVMSGWELVAHLQHNPTLASVPVVVLSAVADDVTRQPDVPIAALVRKRVDIDTLLRVVDHAYARHVTQA